MYTCVWYTSFFLRSLASNIRYIFCPPASMRSIGALKSGTFFNANHLRWMSLGNSLAECVTVGALS